MRIHWLHGGIIDATCGLVHIQNSIRPVIATPGDIIILEGRCSVGGRAVSWSIANNVSFFITSSGATKLYYWLPVARSWEGLAQQAIACNTPRVINEVARWMLQKRFHQTLHPAHGVNVVRGREGTEIRRIYKHLSAEFGIPWEGRQKSGKWNQLTPLNKTISLCNAALYGLTEIAILHAGYSPFFGFLHGRSGKALVYDIADMVKFEHITPIAFRTVADGRPNPEWRARAACIRLFRRSTLLRELISLTEETMDVAIKSLTEKPSRRSRKNLPGCMAKN